jgi:hypothetical protein
VKDAYAVLHQKEAELDRVRKQVESLNIAALLLADEDDKDDFADDADEDEQATKKPSVSAKGADSGESRWNAESSPFLKALKRAM